MRSIARNLPPVPSWADLKAALASARREYLTEEREARVAFVGCLVFGNQFRMFHWDGRTGQFSTGTYFVEGTGSERFKKLAKSLNPTNVRTQIVPHAIAGLGTAIGRIGHLLGGEIFDGLNLPDFFGGGFDMVFFDGQTFRRMASLVQIFLTMNIIEVGEPSKFWFELRGPSFWQSFNKGLKLERIEFFPDAIACSDKAIKMRIKAERSANAPWFWDADCGDPNPSEPRCAVIHTRAIRERKRLANGCTAYILPNDEIKIVREPTSVSFEFSEQFVRSQCQLALSVHSSWESRARLASKT